MAQINILVLGVGGGGVGEQILKALHMTTHIETFKIGTDISDFTSGKRFLDEFYIMPSANSPEYKDRLLEIIDKHKIQFVFPGSEPEMIFLSENRSLLENRGISHSLNTKQVISTCSNKYACYTKLENEGLVVPRYKKIDGVQDISDIDFFPIILKPNVGSGGSASVHLATDMDECELLVRYMLKNGIDIVAQQYVGDHAQEYTIGVNSDHNGQVMGSIAIKRRLTNALSTRSVIKRNQCLYMISSGLSQGEVCHRPTLQAQAERVAIVLDSRGPINVQCREVDGALMLFEVNPRLSGTTALRAMAGYNEPEALILKYVLGQELELKEYREMRIARTVEEIVV